MEPQLYVVHFRESPDSPQWEQGPMPKDQADAYAYKIYLNGGMAVVVPYVKEETK